MMTVAHDIIAAATAATQSTTSMMAWPNNSPDHSFTAVHGICVEVLAADGVPLLESDLTGSLAFDFWVCGVAIIRDG